MGENKEQAGFKVVDKRRFSSTGESQDSEEREEEEEKKETDRPTPPLQDRSNDSEDLPPVDFSWFVVSLATQAMVLLGEIPDPLTHQPSVNIRGAKQTIDILGILEEKTKGNLSEEESRLLEDLLANLRITFVKKVKEQRQQSRN